MKNIKRRSFLGLFGKGAASMALFGANGEGRAAQPGPVKADSPTALLTDRPDGRFPDTAGFIQAYMKGNPPKLAFDPSMSAEDFPTWQARIREKMTELLAFPEVGETPPPKRLWKRDREGYELQGWEAYPEPYSVVPFLLLVPKGLSAQHPAPGVMCFPGSSGSKEALAGEPPPENAKIRPGQEWKQDDNEMALHMVRQGYVACAVDNPAKAALASPVRNFLDVSACAIWTGRSYLGISVFQKAHILEWLVQQPFVDDKRIAVCGHSLGSDPADALGVLYPDRVHAVIHNDFCCDWRERAIALSAYPGGLHHVVPGMFAWYDAPDLQAALAPTPLLFTEGGRTPHLNRIRAAYRLAGAEENVEVHYYKKYLTPDLRPKDTAPLPEGITMEEYFEYANVDPQNHRFRTDRAMPWLAKVL